MSGESRLPTKGGDRTEALGEAPGPEFTSPRTPDESTAALPALSEEPASKDEADLPRLAPGERLAGRFEVLRFIARGGMGAVYEAEDVMLRARVALKLIRGRIVTDATAMERFRREVLLARRVSHPNVCRVYELYDTTTAGGVAIHFLTMELLEGETLSRRIARDGRLTPEMALPLVRQMCEGLAAAHAEGVIHRDFKSSNILLVPRREASGDAGTRVVITDFGIARAVEIVAQLKDDGPLTGGADLLGTPEYMAPEQVTGRPVTAATDIYALGVVLYEMITGKLPFPGDTPLISAARRLDEPPPSPETTTPGLDERWSATVLRCLAREPERRFTSPLEIPTELVRPRKRWPRVATVNALVIGGMLIGVAVVVWIFAALISGQTKRPQTATPAAIPRQVVAILGFRDELRSPDLTWLSTAVAQLLEQELAAAETSLRVISADRVAMVRRSLGVSEDVVSEENDRQRMQALLASNVLVYGSLNSLAQGSPSVRLSLGMVDASTGRVLARLDEDLGQGVAALVTKLPSIAERLRDALGVSMSPGQSAALAASRWRNLSAIRSYAQGLISLRKFEYSNARSSFEAALASEPTSLDAQWGTTDTWHREGYQKKAREFAERIRAQRVGPPSRHRAEIDANLQAVLDPAKGTEAFSALFDATPDDLELGQTVMWRSDNPKTVSVVLGRLRGLPPPVSEDIHLDIVEARAAWQLGNRKRADELLERMRARAESVGARTEVAQVLWGRAEMVWLMDGRPTEALKLFLEAEARFEEVGELESLGWARNERAYFLTFIGPPSRALKALEESAAIFRRLGNRSALSSVLILTAAEMEKLGELDLAKSKLHDALEDSEVYEDTPAPFNLKFMLAGRLALSGADMDGVRKAVRMLRSNQSWEQGALALEGVALIAQDHLKEAREALGKEQKLLENGGIRIAAPGRAQKLCSLACEEGHPDEGLACLEQIRTPISERLMAERFAPNSERYSPVPAGDAGKNNSLETARCRYLAGDLAGAETAAQAARKEAEQSELYEQLILSNVYLMRARGARGRVAEAIASLRGDLAEATRRKTKSLAFEIELALGDLELRAGKNDGRARLLGLEQEAKSKEFFRIARLAREALAAHPGRPSSRPVH